MGSFYCLPAECDSPYDTTPEEAKDDIEGQGAPDDKVVYPGPVSRVQCQLCGTDCSQDNASQLAGSAM